MPGTMLRTASGFDLLPVICTTAVFPHYVHEERNYGSSALDLRGWDHGLGQIHHGTLAGKITSACGRSGATGARSASTSYECLSIPETLRWRSHRPEAVSFGRVT